MPKRSLKRSRSRSRKRSPKRSFRGGWRRDPEYEFMFSGRPAKTPLEFAWLKMHFFRHLTSNDYNDVKKDLMRGADRFVNVLGEWKTVNFVHVYCLPLVIARDNQNEKMVELLKSYGAQSDLISKKTIERWKRNMQLRAEGKAYFATRTTTLQQLYDDLNDVRKRYEWKLPTSNEGMAPGNPTLPVSYTRDARDISDDPSNFVDETSEDPTGGQKRRRRRSS